MKLDELLFAAVIRLYPARFRARFGAEMLSAYLDKRDALAGTGLRAGVLRHTLATLCNLLVSLPAVHFEEGQRYRPRPSIRQTGGTNRMQNFAVDLRHAVRSLRQQPGFAAVTILTLALGIGANTAVFSVLNSVVLAPLPYDQPEQLVRLYTAQRKEPDARQYLTVPDLLEVRDGADAFAALGTLYTYRESGADLTPADGPPRRIRLLRVSSGYFPVLRATPLLGRTFTADEDRADVTRVVLSYRLWRETANADPAVVGRAIPLNGQAYEVIGVMRPGFRDVAGDDVAAWVPANLELGGSNNRGNHYLSAIARLRPGATQAQAQAQVDAVMARLAREYPHSNETRIMRVLPLLDDTIGESRSSVYVLMGAAGLVLLIACLNVANLFLARSLGQARVLAIRAALGADRTRLIVLRLTESVLVALVGGLVGSLVAFWGVKLLLSVSPESLARAEEVGFDPRLLGFALATTVLTGLVFGAAPAWRAARVDPTETLHEGSRGNTGGRGSRRVRDVLVASQVAVALILLIGAGVLMKSFTVLQRLDLGFAPDQVETFEVNLPEARYGDPAARVRFHERFGRELQTLPGVEQVGATSWLPANGEYHYWGVAYRDHDGAEQWTGAQTRVVDGDYFEALGIPLLRGRRFGPADAHDTAGVALLSQSLARAAFGERDPIGQTVKTGGRAFRVIGVVADAAYDASGAKGPQVYLSHTQFAADRNWSLTYVVRTATTPDALVGPARAALATIDPALVLHRPRPLNEVVARHRARERLTLLLMGTFAAVALSLAAVGVYGVLSYAVTQRVHEIGVRMALGARPGEVRLDVLRHGVAIAASGMAVGLVAAVGFSRVLQTLVFGVSPRDPLVFGGVVVVLGVVVLVAGYLPARRATQVHPLEALRGE
jgi:putative ABC transport system permease protein